MSQPATATAAAIAADARSKRNASPRPTGFPQAFPSSTALDGRWFALGCSTANHPVLRACKFNGGNSARACRRVDFCAFPRDVRGPRGSRSNTKTGRGWPGIEMGDQIGRPHNLLPSYLDRLSFCAPQTKDDPRRTCRPNSVVCVATGQQWTEKFLAMPYLEDSSGPATQYRPPRLRVSCRGDACAVGRCACGWCARPAECGSRGPLPLIRRRSMARSRARLARKVRHTECRSRIRADEHEPARRDQRSTQIGRTPFRRCAQTEEQR
jgi:hypothetical protein